MTVSRTLAATAAALLALSLLAGCGAKQAPPLSAEQLQAGLIGEEHPVTQEQAQAQGCSCHLKTQQ